MNWIKLGRDITVDLSKVYLIQFAETEEKDSENSKPERKPCVLLFFNIPNPMGNSPTVSFCSTKPEVIEEVKSFVLTLTSREEDAERR